MATGVDRRRRSREGPSGPHTGTAPPAHPIRPGGPIPSSTTTAWQGEAVGCDCHRPGRAFRLTIWPGVPVSPGADYERMPKSAHGACPEQRMPNSSRISSRAFWLATMVLWVGALASMWLLRNYPLRPSPARLMAAYLLAWGLVAILGGAPRSVLRERFVLSTAALCLTLGLPELVSRLGWVDFRQVFATPMIPSK